MQYAPLKVLHDPKMKWLLVGWVSKQVKKLEVDQFKASQLELPILVHVVEQETI